MIIHESRSYHESNYEYKKLIHSIYRGDLLPSFSADLLLKLPFSIIYDRSSHNISTYRSVVLVYKI